MKTWPGGVKPHRRTKKNRAQRHAARGTVTVLDERAQEPRFTGNPVLDRSLLERKTVAELQALCTQHEVPFKSRDRKAALVEKLAVAW